MAARPGIYLRISFTSSFLFLPGGTHEQSPSRSGGRQGSRSRCSDKLWLVQDWQCVSFSELRQIEAGRRRGHRMRLAAQTCRRSLHNATGYTLLSLPISWNLGSQVGEVLENLGIGVGPRWGFSSALYSGRSSKGLFGLAHCVRSCPCWRQGGNTERTTRRLAIVGNGEQAILWSASCTIAAGIGR